MKPGKTCVAALLALATCIDQTESGTDPAVERSSAELGKIPPSEVAVWQKLGSGNSPFGRYLQAAAFDEDRKVVVVFGGLSGNPAYGMSTLNQDIWEWNPSTGKWTDRTPAGTKPDPRSGAAMVYDSIRSRFILFGGRAGSGYNLEDTWEWNPSTGEWTDVGATGHPAARSQHAMVFEKSTGKVLLFGGGRSSPESVDGTGVSISFGDTWEYNPVTSAWAARAVTAGPSGRNDSALVWDSSRNKAVLFGGIQIDIAGAAGAPKQDVWDWDPAAGTWTERTASGAKPSQRYGHAAAFDGTRKKMVLFGGWDMSTGLPRNDLWDWDPSTGAWTQRLTGAESGVPVGRMYASMVSDETRGRLVVVAGALLSGTSGTGGRPAYPDAGLVMADMIFQATPSREIWELDPVALTFANRTPPLDAPTARYAPAVAFNPVTGKTCLFGGSDEFTGVVLDDYWEWDGRTWTQIPTTGARPSARAYAAMAFDPARNSMILFSGDAYDAVSTLDDTWELTSAGTWTELNPANHPPALMGHGMVTDTTRNKILLFGGFLATANVGPVLPPMNPAQNSVWEWDGAAKTWTDRTPPATANVPVAREFPALAYDEGRQKMFLFNGYTYGTGAGAFSEWDPVTGGWAARDFSDMFNPNPTSPMVAYDSLRRREVIYPGDYSSSGAGSTWEIDSLGPTLYVRQTPAAPPVWSGASMVFDNKRGVVVFIGANNGSLMSDSPVETWEYKVTGWGNGEGCTAATASQCTSGFCTDGVCCEVAACTGACKACNVQGSEGTCAAVKAGTEVAGSCDSGKACDGTGTCKAKNGLPCTTNAECASGFCVDGFCCNAACSGPCVSCNQTGRAGICTPYQAGTDPQGECGEGEGVCKSTCDGAGTCAFPGYSASCGNCYTCNSYGYCSNYDYICGFYADGGPPIRPDGGPYPVDVRPFLTGGSGGSGGMTGRGGVDGSIYTDGGPQSSGGVAGLVPGSGGGAGTVSLPDGSAEGRTDGPGGAAEVGGGAGDGARIDGSAGSIPGLGGTGGLVVGAGGAGGRIVTGAGGGGSLGGVRDAAAGPSLSKSGCNCRVGQPPSSRLGLESLLAVGLALLLVRKRRHRA
jgi:MYXO-CTERM domain-containing protein